MTTNQTFLSTLLSLIIQTYHFDATSVCMLWNDNFPVSIEQPYLGNYVAIASLYKSAFSEDEDIQLDRLDLMTEFEEKLTEAIEYTHCESFIAFEEEIEIFVNAFSKSVLHSKWRSLKNKFLFVYNKDRFDVSSKLDSWFFKDLANILIVEVANETLFNLRTTKFVGSRKDHPEELIFLDSYHGDTRSFDFNQNLYPDKTRDLKGREVISATFPYEPFSILRNATSTNVMDVKYGNTDPTKRLLYDGTDAQNLIHLCWLYNCTLQIDTSEEEEWGFVYPNFTATGALGMVFERRADICMMAMYMWLEEVADSVERLAKHKLIWMATAYNWILTINGSDEELMKRVLENFRVYSSSKIKEDRKFAKSIGYAIERLQFGHFALPDYLDQEIADSVKIMVDDIYYQYCVAFVSRSWAMLDKFNNMLLMMHSSGLTQFLEWKVVADHLNENLQKQIEASVKPNFDDDGPVKLGMENFAGIISVLIIGVILSILVFIGELLYYRYYDDRVIKKQPAETSEFVVELD